MAPNYRLTTFVLAGGYCGIAVISLVYVSVSDRFGFSVFRYQQWCLLGLIVGAFIGLGFEFAVRVAQRPGSRFSIREFMLAVAIVAAAFAVCGSFMKWMNRPERGVNNAGVPYNVNQGHTRHR